MTLPASVRINAQFPFPSLVTAKAPIFINKSGGIWGISYDTSGIGVVVPPSSKYATDYVLFYDSITKTYSNVSLSNLPAGIRAQRSVTSAITLASTDQILNCNIPSPTSCTLLSAASRGGVPLTFKDVGPQFGANPLTIVAAGGDTIDGQASIILKTNRQAVTLNPFTDGVNTGWFIT